MIDWSKAPDWANYYFDEVWSDNKPSNDGINGGFTGHPALDKWEIAPRFNVAKDVLFDRNGEVSS